uniref:Small ribosomal subunit protein uS3m n=1 Tax=Usnea subgracilis TaxID=2250278 RepID=A0A482G5P3_9LECA|nr:ribosomal protein S3 [Usnea subgracilis]
MKNWLTNKDNTLALFLKRTKGYTSSTRGKKIELESPSTFPCQASFPTENYVEKPRHYPPANKEWFNSIYTYGKATQKLAPTLDKVTQKLVKGYLDFYSDKLEGRVKPITKRMRRWTRRASTNRILISRAELKHTNDRVSLTVYVYNRQKQYYLNKLAGLGAIVNSYLKTYVTRSLRRQMLSIYLLQLASFNESKFDSKYLLPLTNLLRRVYSASGDGSLLQKEVTFNFVNLKYPYLNSSLLSSTLVSKIKNRKTKLLTVLRASLAMYEVPRLEDAPLQLEQRATLYKEIYNRKRRLPNIKIPSNLVNTTFKSLKNKAVTGIRLEVAGRLTRRYTAARSLFKLRYKGNLKNMDASNKGLSAVLLRGHAKSNLGYTQTSSSVRIGSFGVKGWVSSS